MRPSVVGAAGVGGLGGVGVVVVVGVVVAAVMLSGGCGSTRVRLRAPSSSSPPAERQEAYQQLRPLGTAGAPDPTNQLGLANEPRFPFLQLANGQRVVEPLDLLPVVDDDSLTAAAVKRAGEARDIASLAWTGGLLALTGGLVAVTLAPVLTTGGDLNSAFAAVGLVVIGGGVALGGTVGISVATWFAGDAEAEKMSAFLLYDGDLRRHLALAAHPAETPPAALPTSMPAPLPTPMTGSTTGSTTLPPPPGAGTTAPPDVVSPAPRFDPSGDPSGG